LNGSLRVALKPRIQEPAKSDARMTHREEPIQTTLDLPERKIYSVSELTAEIREMLEDRFPSVWIQGEISNFKAAPSGHYYFTLKDDSAQIRSVIFKTQNRFLKFRLEDGLKVIAWGRVSVYGPRGEYQLILDTMEPAGFGSLMLAFEQLRNRLAAEGLFDSARKKPMPRFPKRIGLVTSSRGAAVRDMIRIILRRFPGTHILICPATVQGDRAPDEIVTAIRRLCEAGDVDVIIVGRGGGSVEDLWAFNDERVVRAVATCPVPIVSAVGHETDFTLTDFAADLRASTPSAAAEMLVPDRRELADSIVHLAARLRNGIRSVVGQRFDVLKELVNRLYDPRRHIEERRMRLDDITLRLSRTMARRLETLRQEVLMISRRLRPQYLERRLLEHSEQVTALTIRLERSLRERLLRDRAAAENLAARLDGLSPLAILARGFSITLRGDTGAVVTDAGSVAAGDQVRVRLHHGRLRCTVIDREIPDRPDETDSSF
jgi:exodeoxyribonuclease VII large subunit